MGLRRETEGPRAPSPLQNQVLGSCKGFSTLGSQDWAGMWAQRALAAGCGPLAQEIGGSTGQRTHSPPSGPLLTVWVGLPDPPVWGVGGGASCGAYPLPGTSGPTRGGARLCGVLCR